jgi:hypothetical protein
MAFTAAKVFSEIWQVDARLAELQLDRPGLLRVREKAISMAANATPFHPANAAGTFGYHYGTAGLREEFVGSIWRIDRPNGVECIRNDGLKVQVAFANVDVACEDQRKPKPLSQKGAGAERLGSGNLFQNLPEFAPTEPDGWKLYYLMVDERGAAELTRPVVSRRTFTAWPERIYLSDGSDLKLEPTLGLDEGDVAGNFDPQVIRK